MACKPTEHDVSHCNIDHCFTRCCISLVVLAVPSVSSEPTEGSLDDPTLWQHDKSFDLCWSQHSLQQPAKGVFDARGQVVSAVGTIGEDHLQPFEPRFEPAENSQDQHGSIVILDIGRMDNERQHQAQRVDNDMTLASVNLLAGIITSHATYLRRFDGLTVDNCSAGRRLASHAAPKHVPQCVVNPLPSPLVAPAKENPVNCLPVGKFVRQKPPGATAAYNIDDRVKDGATADCLRSSSARGLRQEFSKNLPLFVGEVREIFRSFRAGHRYDSFRSVVGNRKDSYRFLLI